MITRGVYSATCSILNNDYSLNVDATIAHAASTINNGLWSNLVEFNLEGIRTNIIENN